MPRTHALIYACGVVVAWQGLLVGYSVPAMEDRQLSRRGMLYRDYMSDVRSALIPVVW